MDHAHPVFKKRTGSMSCARSTLKNHVLDCAGMVHAVHGGDGDARERAAGRCRRRKDCRGAFLHPSASYCRGKQGGFDLEWNAHLFREASVAIESTWSMFEHEISFIETLYVDYKDKCFVGSQASSQKVRIHLKLPIRVYPRSWYTYSCGHLLIQPLPSNTASWTSAFFHFISTCSAFRVSSHLPLHDASGTCQDVKPTYLHSCHKKD